MKELYKQMMDTSERIGIKILSDEFCCELIAWLYIFGGGCEDVVVNYKLNTDIQTSQTRLNLFGGEIPNQELHPIAVDKIRELELFDKAYRKAQSTKELKGIFPESEDYKNAVIEYPEPPAWLIAIFKKYNIKPPFKYVVCD